MGKTKLTRKEILGDDPIRATMIQIVDTFRTRSKTIGLVAVAAVLIGVGIYFGLQYLAEREMQAQAELTRGMTLFHARIDPAALDDPYGKGPEPLFRNEEARYKAALEGFSSLIAEYGSSKPSLIARYYLGLCQLHLGQPEDAVRNLEEVRSNTRDRTVGYLAKKVLATHYMESGKPGESTVILEGMLEDPQCELPREVLRVDLARAYLAAGKTDDARNAIRKARDEAGTGVLNSMVSRELDRLEEQIPSREPVP
ncbi:MAG: tetratricopeptide repeat protein [Acidobacteriota bacterium]